MGLLGNSFATAGGPGPRGFSGSRNDLDSCAEEKDNLSIGNVSILFTFFRVFSKWDQIFKLTARMEIKIIESL